MTTDSPRMPIAYELAVPAGDLPHRRRRNMVQVGSRGVGSAWSGNQRQRPRLRATPDLATAYPVRPGGAETSAVRDRARGAAT